MAELEDGALARHDTPGIGTVVAVETTAAHVRLLEQLAPGRARHLSEVEPLLHLTATAKRRARSAP